MPKKPLHPIITGTDDDKTELIDDTHTANFGTNANVGAVSVKESACAATSNGDANTMRSSMILLSKRKAMGNTDKLKQPSVG